MKRKSLDTVFKDSILNLGKALMQFALKEKENEKKRNER